MEYLPGNSKLINSYYYEILHDFNFVTTDKTRLDDVYKYTNGHYRDHGLTVPLFKNDIIEIKLFTTRNSHILYCYLVKVIRDNTELNYNSESFVTLDFLNINHWLFSNITTQLKRDKIIDKIIS